MSSGLSSNSVASVDRSTPNATPAIFDNSLCLVDHALHHPTAVVKMFPDGLDTVVWVILLVVLFYANWPKYIYTEIKNSAGLTDFSKSPILRMSLLLSSIGRICPLAMSSKNIFQKRKLLMIVLNM